MVKVSADLRFTAIEDTYLEWVGQRFRQTFQLGDSFVYSGYILCDMASYVQDSVYAVTIVFDTISVDEYSLHLKEELVSGAVLPIRKGKAVIGEATVTGFISVA